MADFGLDAGPDGRDIKMQDYARMVDEAKARDAFERKLSVPDPSWRRVS